MWQGTVVDVCDTFCGDATFAATLVQMEQMDQSALEPPKQSLGIRDSVASNTLDSMGRTVNHGSNTSLQEWGLETTLSPHLMHCHPVQARPYLISHVTENFFRVILHFPPQLAPASAIPTPCWDSQLKWIRKYGSTRINNDQWSSVTGVIPVITINSPLSPLSKLSLQCQTFGNRSKSLVTTCKQKLV